MTAMSWVSVIGLIGWLALALSSYRAREIDARKTLLMATAWVGIFLLVTGIIVVVGV